jgi:hypothetical protein
MENIHFIPSGRRFLLVSADKINQQRRIIEEAVADISATWEQ